MHDSVTLDLKNGRYFNYETLLDGDFFDVLPAKMCFDSTTEKMFVVELHYVAAKNCPSIIACGRKKSLKMLRGLR